MTFIDEIRAIWPFLSVLTTIFSVLATLAAGFCLYHLNKRFASKDDHAVLRSTQNNHAERIGLLERRVEMMPDSETMHKIQLSIQEIRGDFKAQQAQMSGISDSIEVMRQSVDRLVHVHMKDS